MAVIDHDPCAFKGENSTYAAVEAEIMAHCQRICALAYGVCQIETPAGKAAAIDGMKDSGMISAGTAAILYTAIPGLK